MNNSAAPAPAEVYNWPVVDADKYLAEYKPGGTVQAQTTDGKTAAFIVIENYDAASGRQCKKYTVDTNLYLACYDRAWYPVRTFEEK